MNDETSQDNLKWNPLDSKGLMHPRQPKASLFFLKKKKENHFNSVSLTLLLQTG